MIISISSIFNSLCCGIAFGLSYKEAFMQYKDSGSSNLSLKNIPLDAIIAGKVFSEYFAPYMNEKQFLQVPTSLFNVVNSIYDNSESITAIENIHFTSF